MGYSPASTLTDFRPIVKARPSFFQRSQVSFFAFILQLSVFAAEQFALPPTKHRHPHCGQVAQGAAKMSNLR
jgi:hypothetical protein